MSLLGNLIWLIFGGFICGLWWILGGLLMCLTIIGIPFGVQAIKIGFATMAPFGRELVEAPDANDPMQIVFNILWAIVFGWELALAHAFSALLLTISIVGIPFAAQHVKLIPLTLFPFGRGLR